MGSRSYELEIVIDENGIIPLGVFFTLGTIHAVRLPALEAGLFAGSTPATQTNDSLKDKAWSAKPWGGDRYPGLSQIATVAQSGGATHL